MYNHDCFDKQDIIYRRVAAARNGERRARTMLASIKGFWKVWRYGDLYMVIRTKIFR